MKPRSDSLFARLSPDQREAVLALGLEEGKSLKDIQAAIAADFGVTCSQAALSAFLSRHSVSWKLRRANEALNDLRPQLPETLSRDLQQAVEAKAFGLAFEELSAKQVIALLRATQETEKLKLARQKWESLEAEKKRVKETIQDHSLTPAEKEARIKEVFGIV